eukprot:5425834-Pyramimonas_sp.AAC.1
MGGRGGDSRRPPEESPEAEAEAEAAAQPRRRGRPPSSAGPRFERRQRARLLQSAARYRLQDHAAMMRSLIPVAAEPDLLLRRLVRPVGAGAFSMTIYDAMGRKPRLHDVSTSAYLRLMDQSARFAYPRRAPLTLIEKFQFPGAALPCTSSRVSRFRLSRLASTPPLLLPLSELKTPTHGLRLSEDWWDF